MFEIIIFPAIETTEIPPIEIQNKLDQSKNNIDKDINILITSTATKENSESLFVLWENLGNKISEYLRDFKQTSKGYYKEEALEAFDELENFIKYRIKENNNLRLALFEISKCLLEKNDPFYNQRIESLLNSINNLDEDEIYKQILHQIKSTKKQSYRYKIGSSKEKIFDGVVSYNLYYFDCLLTHETQNVIEKIHQEDKDLVIIEGICTEETTAKLFENLKQHYSHFYFKINSEPFNFSTNSISNNQGLFIASKYELKKTFFENFHTKHDGIFSFILGEKTHFYISTINKNDENTIKNMNIKQIFTRITNDLSKDHGEACLICSKTNTERSRKFHLYPSDLACISINEYPSIFFKKLNGNIISMNDRGQFNIKELDNYYDQINNIKNNEMTVILCTQVSASASASVNSNNHLKAEAQIEVQSEDGKKSGSLSGGYDTDKNFYGGGKFKIQSENGWSAEGYGNFRTDKSYQTGGQLNFHSKDENTALHFKAYAEKSPNSQTSYNTKVEIEQKF